MLDMKDFNEYQKKFKNMTAQFDLFLSEWITKQGYQTMADAVGNTPVDTGYLRESWSLGTPKKDGNSVSIDINNSAEYASIIEYGTPARPKWKWAGGAHMLTKALGNAADRMPKDFDKSLKSFMNERGIG